MSGCSAAPASTAAISAPLRPVWSWPPPPPGDIGVCLAGTFTPDYASPSTACLLQRELGLEEDTVCFDLNAACAGFLYGLKTAHALLPDAPRPCALVVGAEVISRVMDHADRNTCVLFGDGAGAAVFRREEERSWHTVFGTRGDPDSIRVQGPGPVPSAIRMDGRAVFRFAVEVVEQSIRRLLEQEGLSSVNDLAPGQRPDHRLCVQTPEGPGGPVFQEYGPLRQHLGGQHSHRPGRAGPERRAETGDVGADGGVRRRADLGRSIIAVVKGL